MKRKVAMTEEHWEGILTEIGAGKSFRNDELAKTWNAACDRAISIVSSYKNGEGLFQITSNPRRARPKS